MPLNMAGQQGRSDRVCRAPDYSSRTSL